MSGVEKEFQEIAHSGGQVIITRITDQNGRTRFQLTWQHQRPVAAGIFAVYALPQGIPVGQMNLGGIGSIPNPAPVPGCFQVFIGSDSEGKFGHECPSCGGYWRSQGGAQFCAYCGMQSGIHNLLTTAQAAYVSQFCARMGEIIEESKDGDYVIDMDAVADAAGKDLTKPPFYYAEQSQQNQFACGSCNAFNDILGNYGYCSFCGTRNDLQELSTKLIPGIRDRINRGEQYESCVRDTVAAFDSIVGQYVAQLVKRIPMTPKRRNHFYGRRFHNLQSVAADLKEAFDIDILDGIKAEDREFAALMFHRRHVYEHKGGEADEKYISDSGDKTVKPKQALHENQQSAHRIAGIVLRMAENLHQGFHEMFPADEVRVRRFEKVRRPISKAAEVDQ